MAQRSARFREASDMKRILGLAAVVFALGLWAGIVAWRAPALRTNVPAVFAIVLGGNLILCLWAWLRAPAGSGDRVALPTVMVLSAAMLLGILPWVFWPARLEGRREAGSQSSSALS